MPYPAAWREFYERHLLPREGGYVPGTGTLLGVLPRVWVDAIPNIPQAEIDAQPEWSRVRLEAIRHAAPAQRPALVRDWINGVRDQLQPWGNGNGHTFEYARAGGNAAIVSGAHNLAFSVFYREYIRDTGIERMQVSPRTQETISDSCIRYGEGYAYSLLARAIVSSGIRTEAQLNGTLLNALDNSSLPRVVGDDARRAVGYVPTNAIASGATYRTGQPGYAYTTGVGRSAIRELLHDLTPQQQEALFDEFGRWRRIYDQNKPQVNEREGDMLRTQALHGTYGEYNARREARTQGLVQPAVPTGNGTASADAPAMAIVQASVRRHWISGSANEYQIGIELPNVGFVRYDLEPRTVSNSEGTTRVEYRFSLDPNHRPTLPPGVSAIGPNQTALGVTNPYDGVLLVWRENGQVKSFAIGGEFNQLALDKGQANNTNWGFTRSDFTRGQDGKLDPAYSAGVTYEGRLGEHPGWVDTPLPQFAPPPSLPLVTPIGIVNIPLSEDPPQRIPQNVTLTPAERPAPAAAR